MSATDVVNHPKHYTSHPVFSGECIKYTRRMTFAQGNAFKYLWRCTQKGRYAEDVRKAMWYVNELNNGVSTKVAIPSNHIDNLVREFRNYLNKDNYDPDVALRASLMISIARGV